MSEPRLLVIVASTRPGRNGRAIADWFVDTVRSAGGFDIDVADLAEVQLPLLDEPNHPRLQKYVHQHTRDWSARVAAADAVVVVMPEYNYGFNAAIKNAIDYLHTEWAYKPIGFVSYGGVSGGLRAVQMLKQVVTTLSMFAVPVQVALPNFFQHLTDGRFVPGDGEVQAATTMLDELRKLAPVLAQLREDSKPALRSA